MDMSVTDMLTEYGKAFEKASEYTELFKGLQGSLENILNTWKNVETTKAFVEVFKQFPVDKSVISKFTKAFTNRELIAEDTLAYTISKLTKKFNESAQGLFEKNLLKLIKSVDPQAFIDFPSLEDTVLRLSKTYFQDGAKAKQASEYLKILLPEDIKLESLIPDYDKYIVQSLSQIFLNPVLKGIGLENTADFLKFVSKKPSEEISASLSKKYADIVKYSQKVHLAKAAGESLENIKPPEITLTISEAATIYKMEVRDTLKAFYNNITKLTADVLASKQGKLFKKVSLLNKAYNNLTEQLSTAYEVFETYYTRTLDENPTFKETLTNLETLGKDLTTMNSKALQNNIAELIKTMSKTVDGASHDVATKTSYAIEDILVDLYKLGNADETLPWTAVPDSQGNDMSLINLFEDALTDLNECLASESFDAYEYLEILQSLDKRFKAHYNAIQDAIKNNSSYGHPDAIRHEIVFPSISDTTPKSIKQKIEELIKAQRNVTSRSEWDAIEQQLQEYEAEGYCTLLKIKDIPRNGVITKALHDVYNKLETVLNNAYSMLNIDSNTFSLAGDTVVYALKQEQTQNAMAYVTDEQIMKFVNNIVNNQTLPDIIIKYSDETYVKTIIEKSVSEEEILLHQTLAQACKNLHKGSDSVVSWAQLVNTIENSSTITQEVRSALLSTLNNPKIARLSVNNIAEDPDYLFKTLFQGIENYINAVRKTEKYTVDYFRNKKAKDGFFEKLLSVPTEVWESMAHHSDADTIATIAYIMDELPDFKLRANDIVIDIETSSLNEFRGEVLEITLNIKGKPITFKRHLDFATDINTRPSNSLLDLYAHGELNRNTIRDNFYAYYNKNYAGPQASKNVQYFTSERDLLQAVTDCLYKEGVVYKNADGFLDKTHYDATRLIGHNIQDYDLLFLKQRADATGLSDYFNETLNRFEHVDSLKLIEQKHNFFRLNTQDKTNLKNLMSDYINIRTMHGEDGLWHTGEDFINAIPQELSYGLELLIKNMPNDTLEDSKLLQEFFAFQQHLKSVRKTTIKDVNTVLNNAIVSLEDLETPAFKRALFKIMRQSPVYKNWTALECWDYLKYASISKLLYGGFGTVNFIGFKRIFDAPAVRAWIDYAGTANAPATVAEQLGKKMYDTAKALNRTLEQIKNPNAIIPFEQDIDMFLKAVEDTDLLTKAELKNPALQYLIKNTDAISEKYALAEYIFFEAYRHKLDTNRFVINILPAEKIATMQNVINNKKLFTHKTISDTDLTFAEHNRLLVDNETWESVAVYSALAEDFSKHINDFNLCDVLDKSEIFSPEKQTFVHGAQKVYAMLKHYADCLKGADTKQLYDAQAKIHYTTDKLNILTLRNVLNYNTIEDLRNTLAWTNGGVTFATNDASDIYRKLIKDSKAISDAGIVMYATDNRVWLQLDRNKINWECVIRHENGRDVKHIYINKQDIARPVFKELDVDSVIQATKDEFALSTASGEKLALGALNEKELTTFGENLKVARNSLIDITQGAMCGVQADVMNKATLRFIYNEAPDVIKKAMGNIDEILNNPAWFSETSFNLYNLGTTASKRQIQTGVPAHMLTSYKLTTELALKNQETRMKYIDMLLNNEMRLDVGYWADEANNEAVIKYLKAHPELTVGVLYKDAKAAQGYNIKRIAINTVEDLQNARRLHASVLSNQMYSKAAAVVYNSAYDTGALHILSNIMRLYKIGQLSVFNTGALARNLIDSTLKMFISTQDVLGTLRAGHDARQAYSQYKTALYGMLATSDFDTEVIENLSRTYEVSPADILKDIQWEVNVFKDKTIRDVINASVLFEKYNTALEDIIKTDSNAGLRPQNVEFYFKYISKDLDIDTFYEVHKFITQGTSAGMPKALREALQKTAPNVAQVEGLSDTLVHLFSKTAGVNGYFEQVIRLTQHMQQLRSGMNFAESNLRIAKTHFDYASKTDVTKSIELIFPYYSFKMNNYEYWANIMETQPWVMRMLTEAMERVWNFDEYDTYAEHLELANNESLQYQILSGNVPLFHDDSATLKLNPSFMDVISMTTDPFGNATSSLWAPLNAGFKRAMLEAWNKGLTNQFVDNTFGLNQYAYEHQLPLEQQILYDAPLIGPTIQRFTQQSDKYAKRTDFLGSKYMPSLFGATSRWNTENIKSPEEWDAIHSEWANNALQRKIAYDSKRRSYGSKRKASYSGQRYYYNKSYNKYGNGTRYYNYYNPGYSDYVEYYNKPYSKRYTDRYPQKLKLQRPKRVYSENIYWKYYTKSGKKRWDILKSKATQKNLQMKIKLMYDYYR